MQEISSDQVCFLIVKLRQFQAKEAPVIPDPGDNVTDDADREVLFDLPDDATEEEIRAFFEQLNEDEKIELLAMLWLGASTYEDWSEAVAAARQDADSRRAETFLSIPLAADYLEDALGRFGFSCADVDAEHLQAFAGRMIAIGVGGWTYEPWRGTFFPPDLPRAQELSYAGSRLGTIEINGTFYRTQKPESFRRWARATPNRFVFAVKAPRYATNRPRLAEAGSSIEWFFASGVAELGDKLGPVLWQLPPNKRFDADDLDTFLALLPRSVDGRSVRHALEVRNESFRSPQFLSLLRRHGVALVFTDSPKYPSIADLTADFVYARLQRAQESEPDGYAPPDLDCWAARLKCWASGGESDDLPRLTSDPPPTTGPRDCFVYMIDGAKVRAPAAAMALLTRLDLTRASRLPLPPGQAPGEAGRGMA